MARSGRRGQRGREGAEGARGAATNDDAPATECAPSIATRAAAAAGPAPGPASGDTERDGAAQWGLEREGGKVASARARTRRRGVGRAVRATSSSSSPVGRSVEGELPCVCVCACRSSSLPSHAAQLGAPDTGDFSFFFFPHSSRSSVNIPRSAPDGFLDSRAGRTLSRRQPHTATDAHTQPHSHISNRPSHQAHPTRSLSPPLTPRTHWPFALFARFAGLGADDTHRCSPCAPICLALDSLVTCSVRCGT